MNPTIAMMKKMSEDDPTLSQASYPQLVCEMLARLGEDPQRDGLLETPKRVEKAMEFLTKGYRQTPSKVLNNALFDVDYADMVVVRDIEMFSMCEHHMLPFFGRVHIAYIPNGKVIGLSKLPRLVEIYARRLQVQERMTQEIAKAIDELIHPKGVGVMIEARHLCMMMRGVEKQLSTTLTTATLGDFARPETRAEFLANVRAKNNVEF